MIWAYSGLVYITLVGIYVSYRLLSNSLKVDVICMQ